MRVDTTWIYRRAKEIVLPSNEGTSSLSSVSFFVVEEISIERNRMIVEREMILLWGNYYERERGFDEKRKKKFLFRSRKVAFHWK